MTVRGKLRAQSIDLLTFAALTQAVASLFSVFGTYVFSKELALNYFVLSVDAFTTAVLMGLMFIELIRKGRSTTKITFIGAILCGYLLMEPIIYYKDLIDNLIKVNNFWERTSLRGFYGRIMIIVLMFILLIDFLYVSRQYIKKTITPEKKRLAKLFAFAVLLFALPYLTISPLSFINPSMRTTIVPTQFIFTSLGWLILAIILTKNPYFANLLTQTIQALLLIRKTDGILIHSKVYAESMRGRESLFASFMTATVSALSEVIRVGSMRKILFEKVVLNLQTGQSLYAALLTDTESTIIEPVLRELIIELERKIPQEDLLSVTTEQAILEKIDDITERILYPLLP